MTPPTFAARFRELVAEAAADGTLPLEPCGRCGSARSEPVYRLPQHRGDIRLAMLCARCKAGLPPAPVPPVLDRLTSLELSVETLLNDIAGLHQILAGVTPGRDLTHDRTGRHHNSAINRTRKVTP